MGGGVEKGRLLRERIESDVVSQGNLGIWGVGSGVVELSRYFTASQSLMSAGHPAHLVHYSIITYFHLIRQTRFSLL